jgi:ribosomal protein S18 acetylase RimI-like enzyme
VLFSHHSPVVRDARPDDAEALVPLLTALGYPAEADVIGARLSELLRTDPSGRVFVATVDGLVSGVAVLHVTPALHRSTGVGRVTALAVLPSAQRAGVGGRLLEACERHFTALGLERIEITSGPLHEQAYGFYRRHGYQDQGVRFAKAIA